MTEPVARSPRESIPAQRYRAHVDQVQAGAAERARAAARYIVGDHGDRLVEIVRAAANYHDLGKLDPANQAVLGRVGREKLAVPHEDAGAAALLDLGHLEAAVLVACHHQGLFSAEAERAKRERAFRKVDVADHVDRHLHSYLNEHRRAGCRTEEPVEDHPLDRCGFARRIALSCLVDADHSDSATHTGQETSWNADSGRLRWSERRVALDRYVKELVRKARREGRTERLNLRKALYDACRTAAVTPSLRSCEASVGSGKTTAVMAHLLRVAEERDLRHIFVVLPFTNIIRQSVKTYQEALTIPGEAAQEVVAEHHHQADFSDRDLRHLSTLWRAPIIVTTAVQFFETLAACSTARLRKLHELPGSAVFLDEAHAAIPTHMWPQAWTWLRTWAHEWGGHLVLGSGSLARFWQLPELVGENREPEPVPDLAPALLRNRLTDAESSRVVLMRRQGSLSCSELIAFIKSKPGPRLVILNTVQSAAVVASRMREEGHSVLHLSTALAPVHRDPIIGRIERWLDETNAGLRDADWTLVATSCVEAGMDFSFWVGFRESASMASLIQVSGRVNREGLEGGAQVWDFRVNDPVLSRNPGLRVSQRVLDQLFDERKAGALDPSRLTTLAFERELTEGMLERAQRIEKSEKAMEYPDVARDCRVIEEGGDTVVIDDELVARLRRREKVDPQVLLRHSVRVWPKVIEEQGLQPVFPARDDRRPELWAWSGPYDAEFLGYMLALMPLIDSKRTGGFIGF